MKIKKILLPLSALLLLASCSTTNQPEDKEKDKSEVFKNLGHSGIDFILRRKITNNFSHTQINREKNIIFNVSS